MQDQIFIISIFFSFIALDLPLAIPSLGTTTINRHQPVSVQHTEVTNGLYHKDFS
jgi:hypothetical protein